MIVLDMYEFDDIAVHPHACGADDDSNTIDDSVWCRFIPTRVGQMRYLRYRGSPVQRFIPTRVGQMFGQFVTLLMTNWFIPTRVGQIVHHLLWNV